MAPRLKKVFQEFPALVLQDPVFHANPMIETRTLSELKTGVHRSGLWIRRAVNERFYPGLNHGAKAHDARLNGDDQDRTGQPVVAHIPACMPKSHNLGMRGRIIPDYGTVVTPSDDLFVQQDDGPDRNLRFSLRFAGLKQRFPHPVLRSGRFHKPLILGDRKVPSNISEFQLTF
jgi:hypothetical protein